MVNNHNIKNIVYEDKERIARAMYAYLGIINQMEDTFEEAFAKVIM